MALPEFDLHGKVAVVTGAGGLLGRQHAHALAQAGAHVVCADVAQATAQAVANDLPGSNHLALGFSVADQPAVRQALQQVLDHYGRVDALVNNAARNDSVEKPNLTADDSRFEVFPLDVWQQSLDVNVTGVFLMCQAFGGHMAQNGGGSLINVASTYGMVGPDQSIYLRPDGSRLIWKSPVYPATKGAVINFTRFLAAYWGPAGVRANCLSPGGVENGQEAWFQANYSAKTPLGRMASPTDFRGAVVYLASDASRYMTGANLVVDGGWTAW